MRLSALQERGDTLRGVAATARLFRPVGVTVGPPLDGIAERRGPAYVHSYIESPRSLNPNATMPAFLPPLTHEQDEDVTQYLLALR